MKALKLENETYIGDGAYVGFDGFSIILWCDRDNGENWVALEPEVFASLLYFAATKCGPNFPITKKKAAEP